MSKRHRQNAHLTGPDPAPQMVPRLPLTTRPAGSSVHRFASLLPLFLILAVVLTYQNSLNGAFIFDDNSSILTNPRIRTLWPIWESMRTPPYQPVTLRPLVGLSLAVNYAIGGLDPRGYHVFNVAIHAFATCVLYGVLRRSMHGAELDFKGRGTFIAFIVTLIWAVHPLQTSSVSWVLQRSEMMMSLCLLLTLYCLNRSTPTGGTNEKSPAAGMWAVGAVASCAAGMFCKEVMIVAPLIALLYGRAFLYGSWRALMHSRWRVYSGLFACMAISVGLLALSPKIDTIGASNTRIPVWHFLLTQTQVILYYLRLVFFPTTLSIDYNDWLIARSLHSVLFPAILLTAMFGLSVAAWFWRPRVGFLALSFFILLAPTSSFVPISELVAERRMYLALAFVLVLIAACIRCVVSEPSAMTQGARGTLQRYLAMTLTGVAIVLTGVFMSMSARRNEDFRTEQAVWESTLRERPFNDRAYANLGYQISEAGDIERGVALYQQAIRLRPANAIVHYNLANSLVTLSHVEAAIFHYQTAIELDPNHFAARCNYGLIFLGLGQPAKAFEQLSIAVRLRPENVGARIDLARTLLELNRADDARRELKIALELEPGNSAALELLGR